MNASTAIRITLNGEAHTIESGASVADVLREMDLDPSRPKGIAVAVNDEVVPKGTWTERGLEPDDRVEVITARQGG